ncbi:MAG: hypothetical protein SCG72_03945 [Nitrosarchaeum sp.]|jgi:hypothetical protein|nr:hypothetical protein [Nitrosarchaeum sp.]
MTAPELTLFCLVSFLFLCVGVVGGWGIKSYLDKMIPAKLGILHQEFFDEDGNIIADEVVSLRIEPGFIEEFQEDYGGLFDDGDDDDDDDDDEK